MYVDAYHDREKDQIRIVERVNGERVPLTVPAEYVFYVEHPSGTYQSIFGHACQKHTFSDSRKFRKELARAKSSGKGVFESDVNPVFRCLSERYLGKDSPVLHVAFFDIEVDFDPDRGFAPTDDPFNRVTAITIYLSWLDRCVTLALIPPGMEADEGDAIAAKFDDTIVFNDERELLRVFIDVVDDADVLSGWNSEGYDIPYLVNRIIMKLGRDHARRLCLWDLMPREREYIKFKKTFKTYDLVGRVHLDYLLLYQKHNTQQLHSYRLDYVGEIEVGENKVPYEGTLDDLYRKDFEKFIAYNRQDVMLLAKIDRKRRFIELANQIAHANGVLLKTTMGSVALVEQAIINEMHTMGFVVPDRNRDEASEDQQDSDDDSEKGPVVGAYVAKPKAGLHEEVAACDINSLYPSAIRALNMSPETIVGQFRPDETTKLVQDRIAAGTPRADAWEGLFHTLEYGHLLAQDGAPLTVDFEDGTSKTMAARDWHDLIFAPNSKLCVTANGTLFRTDTDGMIPLLLAKWYAQRKDLQANQKCFEELSKGMKVDDELAELIEAEMMTAKPLVEFAAVPLKRV